MADAAATAETWASELRDRPRDQEFAGRVAVVTGASRGLGRATALLLAARGADLVISARHTNEVALVANHIQAVGRRVVVVAADVGEPDGCKRIVDATFAEFGRVDCLVSNATNQDVWADGTPPETIWSGCFNVDVLGAVRLTEAFLPGMRERRAGAIVYVSSISAKTGENRAAYAGYGAMKAALIATGRMFAMEAAADGVRVNVVAPGTFYEPGNALDREDPRAVDQLLQSIPSGRFGRPDEVARSVLFLLSDEASWIVGQCLVVDGGQYPGVY